MSANWEDSLRQLLIDEKIIDQEQLVYALEIQKETGERLDHLLNRLNFAKEEEILKSLALILNIPYLKISEQKISPTLLKKISVKYAYRYKVIPLNEEDGTLVVAMADPLNVHLQDDVRLLVGQNIKVVVASEKEITEAIRQYYGIGAETMEEIVQTQGLETTITLEIARAREALTEETADEASIIKFVNQIIEGAYGDRATDIHLEPFEDDLRIRYRIDGVLHEISTPPTIKHFQDAIVSRIKIMAELNIAEKRLPQDGRIKMRLDGEEIDIRVSTIPTPWGESVDLRLLPRHRVLLGLEQLGLSPENLKIIERLIKNPHGIILVTGPTGSGKTTTLYACLSKINSIDKMIITIEDPVEYQLRGINQIQVKPKINLNFAEGLRSILRHDPNIIMVGEIRDTETAEIAIRASLTGHLVFSTLHTNDACGAITRLVDMGIEPFLVSSSVVAVMAQRLVRLLCPKCKEKYTPDKEVLKDFDITNLNDKISVYRVGKGCQECKYMGYKERTGIYEILLIDDEIKKLVLTRSMVGTIKQRALSQGMHTLRMDGWEKVLAGITTIEEVLRVT